jgi:hypothetical protein
MLSTMESVSEKFRILSLSSRPWAARVTPHIVTHQ